MKFKNILGIILKVLTYLSLVTKGAQVFNVSRIAGYLFFFFF